MIWLLILVVAIATYFDLQSHRIPNWVTYPAIALSFFWFDSFHLIAISLGILFSLIFAKWVGAGDIKLAITISIWSHILNLSQYWIYFALLLGGIAGLGFRQKSIAFAPYMAAGILAANLARSKGFI